MPSEIGVFRVKACNPMRLDATRINPKVTTKQRPEKRPNSDQEGESGLSIASAKLRLSGSSGV